MQRLYAMALSICLSVCLSSVKFVKSFATWQHLAASGGLSYRLRYTYCTWSSLAQKLLMFFVHHCRHHPCLIPALFWMMIAVIVFSLTQLYLIPCLRYSASNNDVALKSHTRTVVRECLRATTQVNGEAQNLTPRHDQTP